MPSGYYRVDQSMACQVCADKISREGPPSPHGAFARAVLFGIGAAILGMIIYATFEIVTGIIIGYVALLVGFMVAKAMMLGSGGYGGRKYQITAAFLTYAAVSMAFIPVAISYYRQHPTTRTAHSQSAPSSAAPAKPTTSDSSAPASSSDASPADAPAPARPSLAMWLLKVTGLGLISPFLELQGNALSGVIGLVILFVGIKIAWKTAAGRQLPVVTGPY